jgi:lysocardiolipin and lysophospholipid acyltransferase
MSMTVPSHTRASGKLTPTRLTTILTSTSRGKFGEDFFSLSSTYFQGRPPKSVNFYWRRWKIADIPLKDPKEFELWLREEWYKKDALMEEYMTTGRFPAMAGGKVDFIETQVRTRHPWEILQVFSVVGTAALLWRNVMKGKTLLMG